MSCRVWTHDGRVSKGGGGGCGRCNPPDDYKLFPFANASSGHYDGKGSMACFSVKLEGVYMSTKQSKRKSKKRSYKILWVQLFALQPTKRFS